MYKPRCWITGISRGWNVQGKGTKEPGGEQARQRTSQGVNQPGTGGERAMGRTSQGVNWQRGKKARHWPACSSVADGNSIRLRRCTLRNAEFWKGVFCGIKIEEKLLLLSYVSTTLLARGSAHYGKKKKRCTILQSARRPCPASLCFAGGDSRLIFIIVLVGLR